jgi:hypothetical protein
MGLGVPRNTPVEIIDKLNKEINAGLAEPRVAANGSDRCDVTEENEREILEEGRVDRAAQRDHDERIAIRRSSQYPLPDDIAAGAGYSARPPPK